MKLLTVKLRVSIEYSDIEYYCKSSAISTPLILTLELDNKNRAVTGSLRKDKSKIYNLRLSELNKIKVLSENEWLWIKNIKLSNDLLRFLVYNDENYRNMCTPPENLTNLGSGDYSIDFGVSSVGYLLPTMLNSNEIVMTGNNSKNNLYQIKLSLIQIRV